MEGGDDDGVQGFKNAVGSYLRSHQLDDPGGVTAAKVGAYHGGFVALTRQRCCLNVQIGLQWADSLQVCPAIRLLCGTVGGWCSSRRECHLTWASGTPTLGSEVAWLRA